MPIRFFSGALQAVDDGPGLPSDPWAAVVWILFLGTLAGLYVIVSRTRRRAEQEYWERKRREEEGRNDRE